MIGENREKLREIIQDAAGVVAQWANQAIPFTPPGATVKGGAVFNPSIKAPTADGLAGKTRLVLRISSSSDLGYDEIRRNWDEDEEEYTVKQSGIRHYNLAISCVAYGASAPAETLELLRTRLQRRTYRTRMKVLNIAIVDMLGIVEVPILNSPVFEGGFQAVLDVRLAWGVNDAIDDETFIETVETITGTVD